MTDRTMISRTEFATTKAGRIVAQLFSSDTRLQFPVLVLFDLAMLADVDINPQSEKGIVVHKRFWASYTVSEKQTSRGNPYRDVTSLEPLASTAHSPETANEDLLNLILCELRDIHDALDHLASDRGQSVHVDLPDDPQSPPPAASAPVDDDADPFAGVDLPDEPLNLPEGAGCAPMEPEPQPAEPPTAQGQRLSMSLFYQLAGPAIAAGRISHKQVNDLATGANGSGWIAALTALQAALETPQP